MIQSTFIAIHVTHESRRTLPTVSVQDKTRPCAFFRVLFSRNTQSYVTQHDTSLYSPGRYYPGKVLHIRLRRHVEKLSEEVYSLAPSGSTRIHPSLRRGSAYPSSTSLSSELPRLVSYDDECPTRIHDGESVSAAFTL